MAAVVAIDPGLTGAIAYYDGRTLDVEDMPTEARGKKSAVDLEKLADLTARPHIWVIGYSGPPAHGVIENVATMPKQGLASACNFGKTIGACEMALVAAGCELVRVTPPVWKFGVGLNADPKADTKARKNASRARATELFPSYAHLFARVKDDGRAEAALMAWWFVHKHTRKTP
jgi:crossover junction endodeoxyribonuclease RuvC